MNWSKWIPRSLSTSSFDTNLLVTMSIKITIPTPFSFLIFRFSSSCLYRFGSDNFVLLILFKTFLDYLQFNCLSWFINSLKSSFELSKRFKYRKTQPNWCLCKRLLWMFEISLICPPLAIRKIFASCTTIIKSDNYTLL